jgi:two-component system response regulator HydG
MLKEPSINILLALLDQGRAAELQDHFALEGYSVEWVTNDERAINCLATNRFDVLLSELESAKIDGLRLMSVAHDRNATTPVIFLSEPTQTELALSALDSGASSFHPYPWNASVIQRAIELGLRHQSLQYEVFQLKRQLDTQQGLPNLVGQSRAIAALHDQVRQLGSEPVIIIGEAGTGRDHLARTIHNESDRSRRQFVKVAFAEDGGPALERTLFGHAAGVFPDAPESLAGHVEYADEGTLYLDNFRAISPQQSEQLIGIIESGQSRRFGETRDIGVDMRIIISITPPLDSGDPASTFLDALQQRFGGLSLEIPAMRDRPEDIAPLASHFAVLHAAEQKKSIGGIDAEALEILTRYTWPGNIRELDNTVQQMVIGAKEGAALSSQNIPAEIRRHPEVSLDDVRVSVGTDMREVERIMILETMKACNQDKAQCAKTLGIGLRTLYRKLGEYEDTE